METLGPSIIRQRLSGLSARNRDLNRAHPRARRPFDHRDRLWDRARKIASHHLRFFSKTRKRFCGTRKAKGRFLSATPRLLLGAGIILALCGFAARCATNNWVE
jgi:hypothetical protein